MIQSNSQIREVEESQNLGLGHPLILDHLPQLEEVNGDMQKKKENCIINRQEMEELQTKLNESLAMVSIVPKTQVSQGSLEIPAPDEF